MICDLKISIVVPIYNVEQYLIHCLDSIKGQTYANIEVILIDDGSPDDSGVLCDEYIKTDSRFKVIHISNGGVAKARQLGVENSTGEYIAFVDPDDSLPNTAIEHLCKVVTDDVDIVIGSYTKYNNDKSKSKVVIAEQEYNGVEYIKSVLTRQMSTSPWSKLYRRKLFSDNSFPNFKRGQDFLMNIDIACKIGKVRTISQETYNYTIYSANSSLSKHSFTLDYYKQFAAYISMILINHNYLADLKREFAVCQLYLIFNVIKGGGDFNPNDPFIENVSDDLKDCVLTREQRIILQSLKSRMLRFVISAMFKMNWMRNIPIISHIMQLIIK